MLSRSAHRATHVEILESCPSTPALVPALASAVRTTCVAIAESFAYSSGLAAAVGGSLTYAVSKALGGPEAGLSAALVASAAFFIYGLDRLRDVERDRTASPRRSAFVIRHGRVLRAMTVLAALGVAGLIVTAPVRVAFLCVPIGAVGVLHRRLKRDYGWKVGYVAFAWTAACIGIPWLSARGGLAIESAMYAFAFVGSSLVANLIASNLREGKTDDSPWQPALAIVAARCAAIGAAALVLVAPEAVAPLAWIPAAEATALCFFRGSERYGHFAVDAALLVGAGIAVVMIGGAPQ